MPPGVFTYDVANNLITVVGGTNAFLDFWNADKAGTLDIVNARNIVGADGAPVAVTRALRPTDYYVLGLADVFITVTNYTAPCTIQLVGTEEYGAAQTENFAIIGNGVYNSTLYWRTIASTQVTVFGGNFTYRLSQGQWGVVWKLGSSCFAFDCRLVIGDGATATVFSDLTKQIIFNLGAISGVGQFWINALANATATFGELVDVTLKATRRGCTFFSLETVNYGRIGSSTTGAVYFYSCRIGSVGSTAAFLFYNWTRLWNCFMDLYCGAEYTSLNADIYNLVSTRAASGLRGFPTCTIDKAVAIDPYFGIQRYGTGNVTVSNYFVRGMAVVGNKFGYFNGLSAAPSNVYLINVDTDQWAFTWVNSAAAVVYRQNTIDIKVTDQDNNPLANATVELRNNAGTLIFSVLTNVAGDIVQQTVSRGYYTQATGDVIQDYSPHALTITRAGYQTYHKHFILGDKVVWEIKLARWSQILLDQGNPVLNIVPADPENKLVMKL